MGPKRTGSTERRERERSRLDGRWEGREGKWAPGESKFATIDRYCRISLVAENTIYTFDIFANLSSSW